MSYLPGTDIIATPPTTSASSIDPKEAAMKARVLNHMSVDHVDSIALYLRYYSKLPSSQIPLNPAVGTLKMEDITLDHIILSHPFGRNLVYVDPPMENLMESRERLVAMHKECLTGLGLSDIKISTFVLPNRLWQWTLHVLAFLSFTTFGFCRDQLHPNTNTIVSKIWSIGGLVPGNAVLADKVALPVVLGMVVIHVFEAGYFARTRLRKHWVQRFTPLWWVWVIVTFNGGIASISRFDSMVEDIKTEREKSGAH